MHEYRGTEVVGASGDRFDEILTPEAVAFVARLDDRFAARRAELLAERRQRREEFAAGAVPDFLAETAHVRDDPSWRVAPVAPGLAERQVEITGPPDRKRALNALNSGARVWMADFEDATSPTWRNLVSGQVNLLDAVEGRIEFTAEGGKRYELGGSPATIVVRPRGWHLVEKHLIVGGRPVSASLFDFGLFLFHCGRRLVERGLGPYFYLPKLEGHREARLWNDVFLFAQEELGLPRGTIRATVLIETITAAFEMEEILHELREHSSGLNAGRWDYVFSVVKNFGDRPGFVLPDRARVTMEAPFLRAYTELLVRTCHKRGAHAIGGMAAFVPSRDAEANAVALDAVAADKRREAGDGFDGSWVAHPGLVGVCAAAFPRPDQLDRLREDVAVTGADLLAVDRTPGRVTEAGLRGNVSVAVRYLESWLSGVGAAAIGGLMEDAATAEISRCQVWQWVRHGTPLAEGGVVGEGLVREVLEKELLEVAPERREAVREVFVENALAERLPLFFTTRAYARHLAGRG
ncbi:malate synthase A [Actinosynnema pretiosum subsp. pretiosum]|uniref:Malate synthase n=2 Tax=Actinosynnema TaxID=40566 RepID=C6WFL8_ACTMD|nr:malate synthase A [Actinosynnema mirum]ACU35953.1 malate synthase A [Actinosynnema mirum DSM 43827]AXX29375.1 Malate synthase [Actinosynnema pretiosum subsp. pretiosum]QUF06375.1 malate synthase A [Actinosynnema pretiosum subsp. pretiosum]